jgi:hypothetical protein
VFTLVVCFVCVGYVRSRVAEETRAIPNHPPSFSHAKCAFAQIG